MQDTKILIQHGAICQQFSFNRSITDYSVDRIDQIMKKELKINKEYKILALKQISNDPKNNPNFVKLGDLKNLLGRRNLKFIPLITKSNSIEQNKENLKEKKRVRVPRKRILSENYSQRESSVSMSSHEVQVQNGIGNKFIAKEFDLIDYWSEALGVIQSSKDSLKCIFILDNKRENIPKENFELLKEHDKDIFCYVDDCCFLKDKFFVDNPKVVLYRNGVKSVEIPSGDDIGYVLAQIFERFKLREEREKKTGEARVVEERKLALDGVVQKFVEELDFGDIRLDNFLRIILIVFFLDNDTRDILTQDLDNLNEKKVLDFFESLSDAEKINLSDENLEGVMGVLEGLDEVKEKFDKVKEKLEEKNEILVRKFMKGIIPLDNFLSDNEEEGRMDYLRPLDILTESENTLSIEVNNLKDSSTVFTISPKSRKKRRKTARFNMDSPEKNLAYSRMKLHFEKDHINYRILGMLKMMKDSDDYEGEYNRIVHLSQDLEYVKELLQKRLDDLLKAHFSKENIDEFYGPANYLFYHFGQDGDFINLITMLKNHIEGDKDKKRMSSKDIMTELNKDAGHLLSVAANESNLMQTKLIEEGDDDVEILKNYSDLRKKQLKRSTNSISSLRLSISSNVDSIPKRRSSNRTNAYKDSIHKEVENKKIVRKGFRNLQVCVGKATNQKSNSKLSSQAHLNSDSSSQSSRKALREKMLRKYYQNQGALYGKKRSILDEVLVKINRDDNFPNFTGSQQTNLYNLLDHEVREIVDCIDIYEQSRRISTVYEDLKALTMAKVPKTVEYKSSEEMSRKTKYNDFKSLMLYLRDDLKEISQKQYEIFLEEYLKEKLYLLGAHEVFRQLGDLDDFIDTLFLIERIKFELHGSSKKNVNQIVKEFQHVIQRQLDILNNYKIYLSDESHRIAKKLIKEGDTSLLNNYQVFLNGKIKLNEFLSKISKTSYEKKQEMMKLKKHSTVKKKRLRKQRKHLDEFLKEEEAKGKISSILRKEVCSLVKEYPTCFKSIRKCFKVNQDKEDFLENIKIFHKVNMLRKKLNKCIQKFKANCKIIGISKSKMDQYSERVFKLDSSGRKSFVKLVEENKFKNVEKMLNQV